MRKSIALFSKLVVVMLGFVALLNAQSLTPSQTGHWTLTKAMSQARTGAAAAAMGDGSVLVAGGLDEHGAVLSTVEVFGADGTFKAAAPMHVARSWHTATWVANDANGGGYVLVTGGSGTNGAIVGSAELYDPRTNSWTLLPAPMIDVRSGHLASATKDKTVVLSGGSDASGALSSVEQYSPSTQQFTFVGAMPSARKEHAAAALSDGRVLLVGGKDGDGNTLSSTAIYDPVSGTVYSGPALNTPRANATATALLDGTVLIAGGTYAEGAIDNGKIAELNSAEIFDPVAGTITPVGAKLVHARAGHLAFLLPNNNTVLLVGGRYNGSDLATAELFNPWLGQFSETGTMSVSRSGAAGAALFPMADGQLLVAGGSNHNSAELYGFATIKTDADDYAPGTPVIMTGSGWKPWEDVTLTVQGTPGADVPEPMTVTADAAGTIINGIWAPNITDLGARFSLTALGLTSGAQARTSFTDNFNVSCTPNPVTLGSSTTCSALGTGASENNNTATWSVTSGSGSFSATTCNIGTAGSCSVTYTPSASGTQTIQAVVSGSSKTFSLTVSGTTIATSVALASSLNPSVYGNAVTLTATVTPSAATGTVTFMDGSTTLGTGTISGGVAYYVTNANQLTAGSHSITAVYSGNASYRSSTSSALTQTVTPKALTISGLAVSSKTYDGTTSATLTGTPGTLVGVVSGDTVSLSGTATALFASKNVGANIAVTVSGQSLTGTSAANYTFSEPPLTGAISTRAITVTAATDSKQYDGTLSASAVPTITSGSLATGDTATWSESYDSKNVGTTHVLTPTGSVSDGNNGANYTVTFASINTGIITARPITVTAAANTKEYDGTTLAAAVPTITSGSLVSGDTATWTESYDNKNVGTNHVLTPAGTVNDGNGGGNYAVTKNSISTGVITARAITVTAAASTKQYDGTTSSSGTPTITSGSLISPDAATFTQTYSTKNVGTGLTLIPTGTVSDGNGGANYAVTFANSANGVITARSLTITATGTSKTYDGTTAAAVTLSDNRLSGDVFTTTYATAAFADKNIGATKTINVTGIAISGADASNYSANTTATATAAITAAQLTVTANNASRVYGASNPTFSYGIGGFVTGETSAVVSGTASCSTSAVAASPVAGSPYAIDCTQGTLTAQNYTFSFVPGTLTITAANASVSPNASTKQYGAADPQFTGTLSGFLPSDNVGATYSRTAGETVAGGPYVISATLSPTSALANYNVTYNTAPFTITAATAAVSLSNLAQNYDGTPKAASVSTVPTPLTFAITYSSESYGPSAVPPTEPGSYSVEAVVNDANYVGAQNGTLVISKADATPTLALLTGMPEPSPYGSRVYFELTTKKTPCPSGQVQFFVDDQPSGSPVMLNGSNCSDPVEFQIATLIPGQHSVYAAYSGDSHYEANNSAAVTHTVMAGEVSVTLATTQTSINVGQPVTFTATVTPNALDASAQAPAGTVEFYDGDSLLGSGNLSAAAPYTATLTTSALSAGPHSIIAKYVNEGGLFGGSSSEVALETVNKIAPMIQWNNPADIVYGTKLSDQQLNATATADGKSVAGTFTYTPALDTILEVGTRNLSVTFTPDDTATYTAQTATATINVTAAKLTITADDATRAYGTANPTFTYQVSGFVNGDTAAALSGEVALTTTATAASAVGTYSITPSAGTLASANYTFQFVNGTLTVSKAPLTVAVANSSRAYGTANPTFSGTVTGVMNGDGITVSYATTATAASTAGSYPINATLNDPNNLLGNYDVTITPGTLTITGATLTIGVAPATKVYGSAMPTFTPTYTGFVNGDTASVLTGTLSFATNATAASTVGNYSVTPSGLTSGAYTIVFAPGALTVTPATLTVTANNQSRAYGAANPTFTYTIAGYVNGDSASVVSGAPSCTTTATTASGSGNYPIACTAGTLSAANYTFAFVPGVLTVSASDLSISAISSPTPNPSAGGTVQITDTTTNTGNVSASNTVTAFYLSSDGKMKTTYLGTRPIPALDGGASSGPVTMTWPVPASLSGKYYVMACADAWNQITEANETDNCSSAQINIAPADLVESSVTILTTNPVAGSSIQVSDTATNSGAGNAGSSTTSFYVSTNGTTKGAYLGQRSVPALNAGASSGPVTTTWTLPTGLSGTYYVMACADSSGQIAEANETNNCTAAKMSIVPADLIESSVTALTSSPLAGGTLQVSDAVTNKGTAAAPATSTAFYLSKDGKAKTTYLGTRSVSSLDAGASSSAETTTWPVPAGLGGTYYIMACADAWNQVAEGDETNNCTAAAINIVPADLVESNLTILTSAPAAGAVIQVSDTVANTGLGNASYSTSTFYLSTNGQTKGSYLSQHSVDNIGAGQSAAPFTTSWTMPSGLKGTYYIMVCADSSAQVTEASETNNCTAAKIQLP